MYHAPVSLGRNSHWRKHLRMPVSLGKVTVLILDDNPLVLKLGRALLETGQVPESIQELTIAKRLGPHSPEVRYSLARALARAKRTREAAQEQAEFARLSALVERAQKKSPPESYRNSSERGEVAPQQLQQPPVAARDQ